MPLPNTTHTPPGWPNPLWEAAWEDFAITNAGQAASYTASELSLIRDLAWKMQEWHNITDPLAVERVHLQKYLNEQDTVRTGSGILGVYKMLKVFWRHYAGAFKGCEMCLDREGFRSHSCDKTPIHGVKKPKASTHKPKMVPVLTDQEWGNLMKAAGDSKSPLRSARDRALLGLLGDSGLRRAEAQALNLADIDLESGTVHVRNGKGGKSRTSEFGTETAKLLNDYLRKRMPPEARLRSG
jgi:integrase